jgi:hypothetical protein
VEPHPPAGLRDDTARHNAGASPMSAHRFTVKVTKVDRPKRQVFGWASIVTKNGVPVVDLQGDVIPIHELEDAVHEYVLSSRSAGDMHIRKGCGRLIASLVFTSEVQTALGIDLGFEGWFCGYQISDDMLWSAIKRGERSAFSIEGTAVPIPLSKYKEA